MQRLKRRFFALRNGVVADCLRRAGAPYRMIFGLTLPQTAEVAAEFGPDEVLARQLWADAATRESVLTAPQLMPPGALDAEEAAQWVAGAPSAEGVDVLCLKLLRREPYAPALALALASGDAPMARYGALRLYLNLLPAHAGEAEAAARAELASGCPLTHGVAQQLIDEIEFMRS